MPPNKKNPSPFFSFSNPSLLLLGIGGSVCFILLLIFVFVYGVDKDITEEDTQALKTMMTQAGYSENIISKNRNFSEEMAFMQIFLVDQQSTNLWHKLCTHS